MKVEVEFEELQALKKQVAEQSAQIENLKYELGKAQPTEMARKMADEYFSNFFESFGIEYPEGATQFWRSPPDVNWAGSRSMNIAFSRKKGNELQYEASIKIIE